MSIYRWALPCLTVASAALIATPALLLAQSVTTGTLAGPVRAAADGSRLPGVSVVAVHQPTGARYQTTTGADAHFVIPNVRLGGPYRVTATLEGFGTAEVTDVFVSLGATAEVPISLELVAATDAIEVLSTAEELINPNRTGSISAVTGEQLETLPTVHRTLQDFARTNPYFRIDPGDPAAARVSVGGRNNRYNSIQIDGAVNNDLFGLADTGAPGGQAEAQPIALDALQEIQLVVSPYDVRHAGFTGGGINAVTRSGSNQWQASLYGAKRDETFVGELEGRKVSAFSQEQLGGRLGGPLVRDRAFFFLSAERNWRQNPTGFSADGQAANQFRDPALAQGVRDVLIDRYGYDPGGLGELVQHTTSALLLAKIDWNVTSDHNLTLRHNWVDAANDRIELGSRPSVSTFSFPDHYYELMSVTNSTVVQLNSTIGSTMFNEARIGLQTIRDQRTAGPPFPHIEVLEGGHRVNAGVNRFSQASSLDQDILEVTNDLTWLLGNHTVTLGISNQQFTFYNRFLDAVFGFYQFTSLVDLEAGTASRYEVGFSNTGRDDMEFDVRQWGFYAGDLWRARANLTLSFGLRVDIPAFRDTPSRNPLLLEALGIDTSDAPGRMVLWQPRFGLNWNPGGMQQVRGGVGVFAGRTPYVWIFNNYQNSGVEHSNLSASGEIAFDPSGDPPRVGSGLLPRIDAIDRDFELPQVLRTTVAYDRRLPWGIDGTVEAIWSRTIKDAYYSNQNLVQVGSLPDGRPRYARRDDRIDAVYLLQNTSQGEELNLSLQLRKRFGSGLEVSGAYAYNEAESLADLTSSRAVTSFRFSPQVDSVHPTVGRSVFEVQHRGLLTAIYRFATGPLRHDLALYFNVQSGSPITYLFSNDVNFDNVNQAGNDPIYVPRSADEVVLRDGLTWEQLDAFISADACLNAQRGKIYERNSCRQPYTRQLDLHYSIGLPVRQVNLQVSADVLNLLNLLESSRGLYRTAPFNSYNLVHGIVDPETGKWSYAPGFTGAVTPGRQYSTHDTRSRWQGRLGLRLSF